MPRSGQFSLALLLVEVALIAIVIGLVRQAIVSEYLWFFVPALAALGAAYGLFRYMLGASEPPDFPPPVH
jgi:hypothetical protein